MNGPAKDAYHAYHVHLGTVRTAPPFEELPMREQDAWKAVAGVSEDHLQRIENARQDAHDAENRCRDIEEKLFDAQSEMEGLTDRIKELQNAKEAAEAKAARLEAPAK